MRELLLRVGDAPAVVLIVEVESPSRILRICDTHEDLVRLEHWIVSSPWRAMAVGGIGLDVDERGGFDRGQRWTEVLHRQGGGIGKAIGGLLDSLFGYVL